MVKKYYVPEAFFRKFETPDVGIGWNGKGDVVGVIPVYTSKEACRKAHKDCEIREIICEERIFGKYFRG